VKAKIDTYFLAPPPPNAQIAEPYETENPETGTNGRFRIDRLARGVIAPQPIALARPPDCLVDEEYRAAGALQVKLLDKWLGLLEGR
jgi:hypothetical protein